MLLYGLSHIVLPLIHALQWPVLILICLVVVVVVVVGRMQFIYVHVWPAWLLCIYIYYATL